MQYKLINKTTGEETLCDKVVIDGFDYYVSDEKTKIGDWVVEYQKGGVVGELHFVNGGYVLSPDIQKKVISTNNTDINVSKLVDGLSNL